MAKGYWIGRVDVDDLEIYKTYVAANAAPFAEYGARFFWYAADNSKTPKVARAAATW